MTMSQNSAWMGVSHPSTPQQEVDGYNQQQIRPMGVKIYYRFDKEAQTDCLAKIPQVHQIHTISMDERQTVGLVDLKVCVRAMVQCSPELVSQPDTDYTLYAYDYSEPETPLVGQGMLSWLWSSLNGASTSGQSEQFVTGKVTKNLLPGIKEFLEVRFKLTGMPRFNRPAGSTAMSTAFQPASLATNPSESSMSEVNEWNAFVQSNPAFGRSANMMVMASIPPPGAAQPGIVAPVPSRQQSLPQLDTRSDAAGQSSLQRPSSRPSSRPPLQRSQSLIQPNPQQMTPGTEDGRGLPTPIDSRGGRTSRPSSRASTRGPTGKPRGRPRKKPLEGTTSGVEDATDAEDPAGPPKKKRAMPTRVDEWDGKNAMGMADSLRVAASTSGSIRTFRPVGPASDPVGGSHLQEVPRVPTPVPGAHGGNAKPLARKVASNLRRESSAAHDFSHQFGRFRLSQSQDARSPAESVGQSPGNYHSPEDSPADIGSSPPVPGPAVYMNSSPASSPILPAMPHADSGFMSGGIEDLFEDEEFLSTCQVLEDLLPMTDAPVEGELGHVQDTLPTLPAAESHRQTAEATASQQSKPAPKRKSTAKTSTKAASPSPWVQEIPGPEELLPATSIYSVPINNTKRIAAENDGNIPIHQPNAKRRKTQDVPPRTSTVNNDMRGASPAQIPPVASMAEPTEQDQAKAPNNATADGPASTRAPGAHATDTTQHVSPKDGSSAGQTARNGHPTPTPAAQSPDDRSQADVNNAKPSLSRSTSSETKSADPPLVLPAPPPPTRQEQPPQSDPPRVEVPPTGRGKNYERKQNIKVRLQNAIARGEMPPFCYNCGAIETSTWRKIWAQDHYGPPPANIELSEKPGRITAVEIIAQDSEGNPTQHRLLKKSLLPEENKAEWSEQNLCNPCGIWIVKSKSHRPQHKWEKDSQRGAQERRRRTDKEKKNNRARSEAQVNPTSEAYLTTDPIGPGDRPSSPPPQDVNRPGRENTAASRAPSAREGGQPRANSPTPRAPSRQSSKRSGGSSNSPIDLTGDLGSTKRLLFPSPRKDGVPKALGELAVNVVQTAPDSGQSLKEAIAGGKENSGAGAANSGHDDMEELFGTPPKQTAERPCTPPPGGEQKAPPRTPFKTPTRATPSHRPITRSVSKSIRSSLRSPGGSLSAAAMAAIQRTPTKTPRSARAGGGMTSARRRGAHVQGMHAHFDRDVFDSPFTATLNQLLSEANDFTADSASHGLVDLDLSSVALPPLPGADDGSHDGVSNHLSNSAAVDFQAFLSTDAVMPSSPPVLRKTAAASGARGTGASAAGTTDATSAGKNGVDLGQLMLDSFNDGDAHMWTDLDHAAKH